jgi:osmotically-inducible protein OsmY
MSNEQVIGEIRASLDSDPRLPHPVPVAVSEREGLVTLRGTVRSFRQRRAAIDIAKSTRGVSKVADELLVDPRDRARDPEIRGAALQALISDPEVPEDRIDVTVTDAWLTLTGAVKHQSDSNAAFEAVSHIAGAGGITNKIEVITAGVDG